MPSASIGCSPMACQDHRTEQPCFVPDVVTIRGSAVTEDVTDVAWEELPTEVIKREQQCWVLPHFRCSRNRTRAVIRLKMKEVRDRLLACCQFVIGAAYESAKARHLKALP